MRFLNYEAFSASVVFGSGTGAQVFELLKRLGTQLVQHETGMPAGDRASRKGDNGNSLSEPSSGG